ncbi:HTH-type transcriptional activator CmpR [Stieleria maiorica]|uniref:HTH-type transcriptional activator CmpR n=1 Tax=Stieleria maiorica TaxID=2795974 RepID=A0A5B9MIB4_9BACT|nr:LysR family transcriptional regulator [Stieleria maiorica]QEF99394.1 HTH-type transcriptional activator CmpR [Stieleria maiorica]
MIKSQDLTIAHLQTFQLVMREGGYAAAARVCHLSVPSVWQHIQALEKLYGVELFQRVGRQVRPTEAAETLSQQVSSILVQIESTFDVVQQSSRDLPIRLVAGARMMLEDLATPLAAFHKRHPNHLVIRQGNDRRAEELLMEDHADIAMALEPGLERKSPHLHYESAYTVEFLAVARRSHPYVKSRSSELAELARHPLVVTLAGTHGRDALDQAFHREGLVAKIAVETDNSAFTIACASAGMGVGIVAGRSKGELSKKLASRSLSDKLGQRRIVLMWRKGRLLTDPMVELVEQLKAALT